MHEGNVIFTRAQCDVTYLTGHVFHHRSAKCYSSRHDVPRRYSRPLGTEILLTETPHALPVSYSIEVPRALKESYALYMCQCAAHFAPRSRSAQGQTVTLAVGFGVTRYSRRIRIVDAAAYLLRRRGILRLQVQPRKCDRVRYA